MDTKSSISSGIHIEKHCCIVICCALRDDRFLGGELVEVCSLGKGKRIRSPTQQRSWRRLPSMKRPVWKTLCLQRWDCIGVIR